MNQAIPFNTSKGGTVPNMCLANVIKGYGIPPKYGSAWEAWEHTQQHTDPVPTGLDVPIYYSYTTTLEGVTANYGHINVRLANGTVWSDGNIYSSINDYTSKKSPKFVGWGESINDIKVIEEEPMSTIGEIEFNDLFRAFFGDINLVTESDRKAWVGGESNTVIRSMAADPRFVVTPPPTDVVPYAGPQLYQKKG